MTEDKPSPAGKRENELEVYEGSSGRVSIKFVRNPLAYPIGRRIGNRVVIGTACSTNPTMNLVAMKPAPNK